MSNTNILFSRAHRLIDVATPILRGSFRDDWAGDYEKQYSDSGKPKGIHPVNRGSGLKLSKIQLNEQLPDDILKILEHDEVVYLITSDRYPIHYVGVTSSGIQDGIFRRNGRFEHHIRKLLAISSSGTQHTKGWHKHAKQRFQDIVKFKEAGKEPSTLDLLGDVWIAFGVSNEDWSSKSCEQTLMEYFSARLNQIRNVWSQELNSTGSGSSSVNVQEPENLESIFS